MITQLTKGLVATALLALATQSAHAGFTPVPQFVFNEIPVSIAIAPSVPGSFFNLIPGTESIQGPANPALGVVGTGGSTYLISDLLDKNNNIVGRQFILCTGIATGSSIGSEPAGEIRMCNQTMSIFGWGEIMFNGPSSANLPTQTLAIVGGTGKFRNATGQLVVTGVNQQAHQYEVYLWQ